MKSQRERRIMILMRLVLFLTGTLIGALSMWQALDSMTISFAVWTKICFYTAAILFVGGVMMLSARPLREGFHSFSQSVRKKFKAVKAVDIAGITLGLLLGLIAAFLCEFLFAMFLPILALRVFIAVVLGLLCAFLTAVAVSGWLGTGREESKPEQEAEFLRGAKGYLLTEAALGEAKIISICKLWLTGNIYVLSKTADKLAAADETEAGSAAYENFKALYTAKAVKILEFLSDGGTDAYVDAAEAKKLKIIAAKSDAALNEAKRRAVVLSLDELIG
ncbi:MAG: hypothetical protein FWH03_08400 [Firmicutes bacterium]|nr:hypothetical protein [Bacillota bacterium]